MKKILLAFTLLISLSAKAADYPVVFEIAPESVGDTQTSSLTSSKIYDFVSSSISALTSSLLSYVNKSDIKAPTVVVYYSGSGTYTPMPGVKWIEVEMVGGGGGGAGAGLTSTSIGPTNGGNGGNSQFGGIIASAGKGAEYYIPGQAGAVSGSISEAVILNTQWGSLGKGGQVQPTTNGGVQLLGGKGAGSCFGSGGASAAGGGGGGAVAFGAGGAGGGGDAVNSQITGAGGGSGGCVKFIISNPTSYNYQVGSGGNQGIAVSGYRSGGNGRSGVIIVVEHYQ